LALLFGLFAVLLWRLAAPVYAGAYLWLASMAVVAGVGAWGVWRQARGSAFCEGPHAYPGCTSGSTSGLSLG
jgi:hypothetical protein